MIILWHLAVTALLLSAIVAGAVMRLAAVLRVNKTTPPKLSLKKNKETNLSLRRPATPEKP